MRPAPSYPAVMRGLGMLYALVTVVAFGFPDRVIASLNATAALTGLGGALPESSERFWLVPATSMMATSAVLFFLAARAPEVRGYAQALLVSKVVPFAAFLYLFAREGAFAYLGGLGADAVLAVVLAAYLFGAGRRRDERLAAV
ncbi:MAG TPA: hypothetical protein VND93_14665 [Myxococcales bacterium]|nr:hypothetical protein [Myxococcales bacterium]